MRLCLYGINSFVFYILYYLFKVIVVRIPLANIDPSLILIVIISIQHHPLAPWSPHLASSS